MRNKHSVDHRTETRVNFSWYLERINDIPERRRTGHVAVSWHPSNLMTRSAVSLIDEWSFCLRGRERKEGGGGGRKTEMKGSKESKKRERYQDKMPYSFRSFRDISYMFKFHVGTTSTTLYRPISFPFVNKLWRNLPITWLVPPR